MPLRWKRVLQRSLYEHGLTVAKLAKEIGASLECDSELIGVMSLLHDIGKTYKADEDTLRQHHAELGYEVAKDFVPGLELTDDQRVKLAGFLKGDFGSIEARVVKDADNVAFFADEKLQIAFKNWADKRGLPGELQRKADRFKTLAFNASRKIAGPFYEQMIARWKLKK